jgi:hypothetical protein
MNSPTHDKYPIPTEVFIREDEILYHSKNALVLDGIDINGHKIEGGLLSVYFRDEGKHFETRASKELWKQDRKFFWAWIEGVAGGIEQGI